MQPEVTFQIAKALADRPQLFALGMAAIAAHSEAESSLSSTMMGLLGTDPAPGSAIFGVIRNNNLQEQAICELASAVLDSADVQKLKEALKALKVSAEDRNQIAHCMWGIDERITDGIVLSKTNVSAKFAGEVVRIPVLKNDNDKRDVLGRLDKLVRDSMEIWRESDFKNAIDKANKAKSALMECHIDATSKAIKRGIEMASAFRIVG